MLPGPAPENSNLMESRKEIQEDGWSQDECLQYCKYQKYISFISMFMILPLVIIPFLINSTYQIDIAIIFGVLGILALLTAFFSYVWAVYYLKSQEKNDFSRLGSLLFVFVTSILIFYILAFIVSNLSIDIYRNEMIAQKSSSLSNFNTDLIALSWVILVFFVLLLISFGYIAFSLYICSVNETFNRVLLNVYLVFFLFFNLTLIYLSTQVAKLMETRALQHYTEPWYNSASLVVGILGTILSFICLFVNLRKYRITYFVIGSIFLIFIVISLLFAGLTHRKADSLQQNFQDNCLEDMRYIDSVDLQAEGCPFKYLMKTVNETMVYDLDCNISQRSLVWENDQSKEIIDQVDALACLNMDCCNLLGNVYSVWFYGLAYCFLTIGVVAFCCVCCLFYLSIKASLGKNSMVHLDYFFWILMLLMLLALALMTQFYDVENLGQEQYLVTSHATSTYDLPFQQNLQAKVYNENGQTCDNFYNFIENKTDYNEMVAINLTCQNSSCPILRLALEGNGNFSLGNGSNSDQLKFFNKSHKNDFFPNDSSTDYDFILFEGLSSNINTFLQYDLMFCLNDYAISPQFSYIKYVYYPNINSTGISTIQKTLTSTRTHKKSAKTRKSHKDLSTLYQLSSQAELILNNYTFGNPKITVSDSDSAQPISQVDLILSKSTENDTCQTEPATPFRRGVSDDNGELNLYNLEVKDYFLYAKAENYKRNCQKISNMTVFDNGNIYLVLVPEFQDQALRVFLFWHNPLVELSLQTSFNYNDEELCVAGYFQTQCGNMISQDQKNIGTLNYQAVDITSIGNYTYLIYAQKLPNEDNLIYYELEQMGNLTNSSVNNQDFTDAGPFIQVYAKEMEYPVEILMAPALQTGDMNEPDLIWLAFCVNGTVGEVSQRDIQHFWTKVEANGTYYNRLNGYRNMLPDSSICKGVYS